MAELQMVSGSPMSCGTFSYDIAPQESMSERVRRALKCAQESVNHFKERASLVDGLLHEGESMNIVAPTKMGKSWLALQLGFCVGLGLPWLGRACAQRRVLYFDNELREDHFDLRRKAMAKALGVTLETLGDRFMHKCLRGFHVSLPDLLRHCFPWVKEEGYGLIIVDALYRALPVGCDENSNMLMTEVYDKIDRFTSRTGVAVAVVHHTSKGAQHDKAVTDIGSGAGAMARSVDTHLAIVPDPNNNEQALLQVALRSFPDLPEMALKREGYLWVPASAPSGTKPASAKQSAPSLTPEAVAQVLREQGEPMGKTELREKVRKVCGCAVKYALAVVNEAIEKGLICIGKKDGKRGEKCSLPEWGPLAEATVA